MRLACEIPSAICIAGEPVYLSYPGQPKTCGNAETLTIWRRVVKTLGVTILRLQAIDQQTALRIPFAEFV